MHGDLTLPLQALSGLLDLLAQHLLVQGHDNEVIEVELGSRVNEHAHNVRQVIQLVFGEEFVVQVKGTEHHVHHRHVIFVGAVEGVVTDGDVGTGRVEHPQVLEPAGVMNLRQQVVKEVKISLAIEDDHGNPVWLFRCADNPGQVLGDDVP